MSSDALARERRPQAKKAKTHTVNNAAKPQAVTKAKSQVIDLTKAKSQEQAEAACRETIKRCNLFTRPSADAVRTWAAGKKILLAVDLHVEQLSSIGAPSFVYHI